MGPGHAVHHISCVLCWFCLSRLCTFFCVERSLSGLDSDICDQWRGNVFELPEVLFLNHQPQKEREMNSEIFNRMLVPYSKQRHVNELLVILKTSTAREMV